MARLACLLALLAACAKAPSDPNRGDGDGDGDGDFPDAAQPDAYDPPDAFEFPDAMLPDGCVPQTEECDGDDDDCDDVPDNGCSCTPNGSTQECYTADPATVGNGPCVKGTQTCMDGQWSAVCEGEVTPKADTCNGIDDDCNPLTPDGSDVAGFGQPCDGTDVDTCNEGSMQCSGPSLVCTDATADSNVILDGGYEQGTGGPWVQSSTLFGTPLCTVADCGTGTGTGPRGGAWWAWYGGTAADEVAVASQNRVIPAGTATLTFYLEIPVCGTGGSPETLVVTIDGTPVFSVNNSDPACNTLGYQLKSIDVSAFANGAAHTLEFRGTFNSGQATATNFFVDDVRLVSCP